MASNTLIHTLEWHLENLPAPWHEALSDDATQASLKRLARFLDQRLAEGATIFPRYPFRALEYVEPQDVRVVILGQDPYHGPDQAQGLAFSVPDSCRCPPSLRNMLAELKRDYPDELHPAGHELSAWARQGVLLLNTVLTVEAAQPASHARKGWEEITDALLLHVAQTPQPKVFMLWGNHAQRKQTLIEQYAQGPHTILAANHPSPLSARRPPVPFLGCGHFRQANQWLHAHDTVAVNWLAR